MSGSRDSVTQDLYRVFHPRLEVWTVHEEEVLVHDDVAGLALRQARIPEPLREEIAEREVQDMLLLESVPLHPAEAEPCGG